MVEPRMILMSSDQSKRSVSCVEAKANCAAAVGSFKLFRDNVGNDLKVAANRLASCIVLSLFLDWWGC